MGLLGFGTPTTQPKQPVISNQSNGGFNLMGEDFLGMGSNQPVPQPVNVNPPQNTGFDFNQPQTQPQTQNQGFSWGVQSQPTQASQPQ